MKSITKDILTKTDVTATFNSTPISVELANRFCVRGEWAVTNPAAVIVASTSIDDATSEFTSATHGFRTGLIVQVTTSDTLPDPLVLLTDYYVIKVDINKFKLATTLVNANAGSFIDLTTAGVGNQTVTPTAASATAFVEATLTDPATTTEVWFAVSTAEAITATGSKLWEFVDKAYHSVRMSGTIAAGQPMFDGFAKVDYLTNLQG